MKYLRIWRMIQMLEKIRKPEINELAKRQIALLAEIGDN